MTVGHSLDRTLLPADVFGSRDHDMDLGDDDMTPLEHYLASRPSSSPHPSLGATLAALGKRSVTHVVLPQALSPPKRLRQTPCMAGSATAPVVMGPLQSSAGRAPKVADISQPASTRADARWPLWPLCRRSW